MYLRKLSILGFKNIEESELKFSENINCFVGGNGCGKTNMIDAIHYLSMCKSAFGLTDGQCVKHGNDFFVVDGSYEITDERRETVAASYKKGAMKLVKRNGKEYERLSDHIGVIPVVLVSPYDTNLINESGEDRRKFLNSLISQLDKTYLQNVIKYNTLLAQRNKLLKQPFGDYGDFMEILDMHISSVGNDIFRRRTQIVESLAPIVAKYYAVISDDREPVAMEYRSALTGNDYATLLRGSFERDRAMQHTTVGVHRDDIQMKIGGYALRKYGSQGQQKSFLIALKLAQFEVISSISDVRPILLLDDIFDKLDMGRVERLIRLVSDHKFGQIFITDSNKVRLDTILSSISADRKLFEVADGSIKEIDL